MLVNQVWYMHTVAFYSAINKTENMVASRK